MKKIILIMLVMLTLSFVMNSCETKKEEKKEHVATLYQCPMDCENGKTYEKEGSCPVCKMDIKSVKDDSAHKH